MYISSKCSRHFINQLCQLNQPTVPGLDPQGPPCNLPIINKTIHKLYRFNSFTHIGYFFHKIKTINKSLAKHNLKSVVRTKTFL